MKRYLLFLLLSLFTIPQQAHEKNIQKRIVVFTPTSKNNTYWPQVFSLLRSTASDLEVAIEFYEFDVSDRFAKSVEGVKILNREPRADGAIFCVAFGQTKPLLDTTEKLGIPVFIQGPLFDSEFKDIGDRPRTKYKSWIGYFYDNEMEKGYRLGKELISRAKANNKFAKDGMIHVIGIGGDHSWSGSKLREAGLIKAVKEEPKAILKQVVPTFWSPQEGREKSLQLLQRYPETSVIWAASDQLGLGASQALVSRGKEPGKDAFVGGLDLSQKGLEGVKNGELDVTVSGTLLSYSEVLVYLVDYIHNHDFKEETGTVFESRVYTASQESADSYLQLYRNFDRINFKHLSKTYNKNLKRYDFRLNNMRSNLKD